MTSTRSPEDQNGMGDSVCGSCGQMYCFIKNANETWCV